MESKIVAVFPTLGKTYYAKHHPKVALDLESSQFMFDRTGYEDMDPEQFKGLPNRVPNPSGVGDYSRAIITASGSGQFRYIFISQHPEVIKKLIAAGKEIWFVIPTNTEENRREFCKRALERGNSTVWMKKVMDLFGRELTEDYTDAEIRHIHRVQLGRNINLSDVLGLL